MLKHYLVLGISFPTTNEEVRGAYLNLVKRFPPERYPEEFACITEAYEALKDATRRTHMMLEGFLQARYPEEEILLLDRLAKVDENRIGLMDLVKLENRFSAR
jgi:curved DNA-binding protein CbpA